MLHYYDLIPEGSLFIIDEIQELFSLEGYQIQISEEVKD